MSLPITAVGAERADEPIFTFSAGLGGRRQRGDRGCADKDFVHRLTF